MLSCNYRVLTNGDEHEPVFEICGVWSNPLPFRYTKTGIKGCELKELESELYSLNEALKKDVLFADERFPEVFDYDEFIKQQKK